MDRISPIIGRAKQFFFLFFCGRPNCFLLQNEATLSQNWNGFASALFRKSSTKPNSMPWGNSSMPAATCSSSWAKAVRADSTPTSTSFWKSTASWSTTVSELLLTIKVDNEPLTVSVPRPLDAVISTVYQKYFHPKECLIGDIRPWTATEARQTKTQNVLYTYGATLNVARPAVVMATTSSSSLPQQRPIAATYTNPRSVLSCTAYSSRWSKQRFLIGGPQGVHGVMTKGYTIKASF